MGPKKKLSKKERQRLEYERAEKAKAEAELERIRQIEEEKRRKAEELRLAKEHDARLLSEHTMRVEQLTESINEIDGFLMTNYEYEMKKKEEDSWERYLRCDGLPNPSNCAEMNTYLHLWDQVMNEVDMDKAAQRNGEVVKILDDLDEFINDPMDATEAQVEDWKWVRSLFREFQKLNLDTATYKLLRDIDRNLNRLDIPTADYHCQEENYSLNIFAMVQLPTPMPNPRSMAS